MNLGSYGHLPSYGKGSVAICTITPPATIVNVSHMLVVKATEHQLGPIGNHTLSRSIMAGETHQQVQLHRIVYKTEKGKTAPQKNTATKTLNTRRVITIEHNISGLSFRVLKYD